MGFNIRKTDKNVTIVDLSGELDRHTGLKDITGSFASMKFDKESRLVFNFKEVTYICSEAVATAVWADIVHEMSGKNVAVFDNLLSTIIHGDCLTPQDKSVLELVEPPAAPLNQLSLWIRGCCLQGVMKRAPARVAAN